MSARAIVLGSLGKPVEFRAAKNGNAFATLSLRENVNGSTRWWQGIAFNEAVIETLREMSAGETVAVVGEFTAETYAPAGGEARVNLRIVVDGVLTARKPRKAKPNTPKNGREVAEASWAAPRRQDSIWSPD